MSWEFKPGMKVVCVNTGELHPFKGCNTHLKENGIYTLNWVGFATHERVNYIGVTLKEIEANFNNPEYRPFLAERFRPLQSKGMDLLNSIVQGVNTGLLVVEDEKYMTQFRKTQRRKQDA